MITKTKIPCPVFITGSYVYGEFTKDSDIDIVLRIDDRFVWRMFVNNKDKEYNAIRFSKLNVILCDTDERYLAWKKGTDILVERHKEENRPISKEEAHEVFESLGALHK